MESGTTGKLGHAWVVAWVVVHGCMGNVGVLPECWSWGGGGGLVMVGPDHWGSPGVVIR